MSKSEQFAQWLFFAFIASIVAFILYFICLRNEEPPKLDIDGRVKNSVIKAGDDLIVHNKFNRPINCGSWWYRYVYDESGTQVQGFAEYRPVGASMDYIRAVRIPEHTRPGRASYQATILWQCNWVQQVWPKEVDLPSITLTITE